MSVNAQVVIGVGVAVFAVVLAASIWSKRNTKKKSQNLQGIPSGSVVSGLFYYPIKSCAGIQVTQATVGRFGFENDRHRVIMNTETNRFVTQRQYPKIALIKTEVKGDYLELTAPNMQPLKLPLRGFEDQTAGARVSVGVWGDTCQGVDEGDAAATWLQEFLQIPNLRIVRLPDDHNRPVDSKYEVAGANNQASYADGFPFLLISEGSLRELNKRIGDGQLKMNRFRPNIVISGEPFVEDTWKKIRIGDIILDVVKPCSRCKMTTIDQEKGEFSGIEPLNTMKTFRKGLLKNEAEAVCFGQNLIHSTTGTVSVGQTVEILEYWDGENAVVAKQ